VSKKPAPKASAVARTEPPVPAEPTDVIDRIFHPQPIVRLEWIRIVAPLMILGFMSSRMLHADDWLSTSGFRIPALTDDWRQPIAFAGLPVWEAWALCATMLISGLMTSLGAFTRGASAVFASTLVYVALADRLAAFTVSKISPIIVIAICLSPAGARYSIDAWRRRRFGPPRASATLFAGGMVLAFGIAATVFTSGRMVFFGAIVVGAVGVVRGLLELGKQTHAPDLEWSPPTHVSWGNVRFFQVMLAVFYLASGIAKKNGDWLSHNDVLWTHLHDSYQTTISWVLANHLPAFSWNVFQQITLGFEIAAPLWFALPWTRTPALVWALGMHLMIGLMFGPVIWFSLLMMTLLIGSYAPIKLLQRLFDRTFDRHRIPAAQIARRT
jgi:hypothetical protein